MPTIDVDVLARADATGAIHPPDPLPDALKQAIAAVARDQGLLEHWMNTTVADQWRFGLPPELEKRIEWRTYGALRVGIVGKRHLICFKLYASADQTGPRNVHVRDLLALSPSAEELAWASEWVRAQDPSRSSMRLSPRWWPMSKKPRFAKIARVLREAASGAAWIQWQALGGQAAAPRPPKAIVDPEALVLASLWLANDEPRLHDFLWGFAELGSRLLSVQRIKRAMTLYPTDAKERLADFAARVDQSGKDPRWRKLTGKTSGGLGRPGKVGPAAARLGAPGSLMVRLRTAFGVDVRTDTLAYLIGQRKTWADIKEISEALLYAKYSVRIACEALTDARLIESHPGRPVKYYADQKRWTALLQLRDAPPWLPWMTVFAFVLRLERWLHEPGLATASPTLAASLSREFMLEHGQLLRRLQIDVPDHRDYPGESYLPVFESAVMMLAQWLGDRV